MRRIANFGFGIAALYFVYLVALLVMAAKINHDFEGQKIGDVQIEPVSDGTYVLVKEESQLRKFDLFPRAGGRPKQAIVLWATWCGPCHSLLMDLKEEVAAGRLHAENIMAVSIAEPLADVSAYLEKSPLPFRVMLDRDGSLAKRMRLQGTPTVIFLGGDGVIEKVSTGGFGLTGKIADFVK